MKLPALSENRDLFWGSVILVSAIIALLATLTGLLLGYSTGIPHLLYIPVVIAAYQYPRRGALIAACIGGIYLLMVVLVAGSSAIVLVEALFRALVIIAIGWLIATLTSRLREQEDLYQGLFDHSEGGSILIADAAGTRTIEEINWSGAGILHRKAAELRGAPVSSVWNGEDADGVFSRLARDGAVYAVETTFLLPDGNSRTALVSAASLPGGRAILTFFDITDRVHAEHALKAANDKLSLLSRFSTDHLHHSVDQIIETAEEADETLHDATVKGYLERIRALAWNITRQLFLTESYKDLGSRSPSWIPVQQALEASRLPADDGTVAIRCWAGRLEIYADPLFADVLTHIVDNSLRHGRGLVTNVVISCHETPDGLDLIISDNGAGIPAARKQQIFEYDAGRHAGIGLFICRQIVEVTGMTIQENGTEGHGVRFVIHVPPGAYRIEGRDEESPALPAPVAPLRSVAGYGTDVIVRELLSAEFPVAETLWVDYHNTKGDARTDRVFAAFHTGQAVALARCRRHPDGLEVDGVFTPEHQRGHGYANAVVRGLVEACGQDVLYMHSVIGLERFYGTFGFVSIDEKELPPTIRDRFAWAGGEMEGANVHPMKREPPAA